MSKNKYGGSIHSKNVTGFVKRVLPHTSNSMNLENHIYSHKETYLPEISSIHSVMLALKIDQIQSIVFSNLKLYVIKKVKYQ